MLYLIKIPASKSLHLARFVCLYDIHSVLSWSYDNFFGVDLFTWVSNAASPGITTEEKDRLIKENFGNNIEKSEPLKP
jgi:hypothetical protein